MSLEGEIAARAEITNNPFRVYTVVDVEMRIGDLPALKPGDRIDIRFPNSWTVGNDPSFTKQLQTADPNGPDYVRVTYDEGIAEFGIEVLPADALTGRGKSRHGRNIRASLVRGAVPEGGAVWFEYRNTMASRLAEEDEVHVSVNGEPVEKLPKIVTLPGEERFLRVLAPSWARTGRTFSLKVISLDALYNMSTTVHRGARIVDDRDRTVCEGLDFQGFVSVEVPADGPGVRRYRIGDVWSNPVKIGDRGHGPYWGDLHIHSRHSDDAIGRYPLRYAREVSCLDFAACADHERSLTKEAWDLTRREVREERRDGTFETILAFESSAGYPDGHHNVYYRDGDGRLFGDGNVAPLSQILPQLKEGEAVVVPHHSGIAWSKETPREQSSAVNFLTEDRGFRPAIEIYSQHGQSELYDPWHFLAYEINRTHNEGRRVNFSVPGPFYAQDAWRLGRRFGVIASSDDHWGQGGKPFQGLAAVLAEGLDRESLLSAIADRSTYATTGERILLEFAVNGTAMGGTVRATPGDAISILVEAHGTSPLMWVEVIAFDFTSAKFRTVRHDAPLTLDHTMKVEERFQGNCLYYARLAQKDLVEHRRPMAWSSPVWVDAAAAKT